MKRLLPLALTAILAAPVAGADVPVQTAPVQTAPEQAGQTAADAQATSLYNAATPFRLLDPSRLTMHQSYSMSYFTGPAGGQSVGIYMNSIGYQLAKPLYLQVDLALMHDPAALLGKGDASSGVRVLPNFSLRYTPSPKFNLMVDVRTMPAYYDSHAGYMPGYGSPWIR